MYLQMKYYNVQIANRGARVSPLNAPNFAHAPHRNSTY